MSTITQYVSFRLPSLTLSVVMKNINLMTDIRDMQKHGRICDTVLVAAGDDGLPVEVHLAMLAHVNVWWSGLVKYASEDNKHIVLLQDVTSEELLDFVDKVYSDNFVRMPDTETNNSRDAKLSEETDSIGILGLTTVAADSESISIEHRELDKSKELNLICEICGKMFSTEKKRKKHEWGQHTSSIDKNFACCDCGKTFLHKSELRKHEIVHSDLKNFACDLCPKKFKRLKHLRDHVRVHSIDAVSYECTYCMKTFNVKSNLTRHIKNCHTNVSSSRS